MEVHQQFWAIRRKRICAGTEASAKPRWFRTSPRNAPKAMTAPLTQNPPGPFAVCAYATQPNILTVPDNHGVNSPGR